MTPAGDTSFHVIKANSAFLLHDGGQATEGDALSLHVGPRGRAGAERPRAGGALSRTEGTRHVCLSPFTREPDRGFVLSVAGRVLTGPL